MESYHGYITPQGIAAEKAREQRVKDLIPEILALVMKIGKIQVSQLAQHLKHADPKDISQAVWKLLDRNILRITRDRCLAMNI